MSFSSDILIQPSTPQQTNSINTNSPRFKNRKNNESSENKNINLTDIMFETKKPIDKSTNISDKMIEKEIKQRKIFLKSQENKLNVYNEVLKQSKTEKSTIDNDLSEICAQFDICNIDSQISFEKKLAQKAELEIEMFNNLKCLNIMIENDQNKQNEQIIKIRNQFINYIENDSVTEIDETNIQEKIDQLMLFLSDFNNNFCLHSSKVDLNESNETLSKSPRRIRKNLKIKKQDLNNDPLQSPKQLNHVTPQKPFIARPNNSKIIYNSSLKDSMNRDFQLSDEIINKKSKKSIKFINKNTNPGNNSTPKRNENKSKVHPNNSQVKSNQNSDQTLIQSASQTNNIESTLKVNNEKNHHSPNVPPENFSTEISSNIISEPTTSTSPRNSPRHHKKRDQVSSIVLFPASEDNDNNNLDLTQSPKFRTENKGDGKSQGGSSKTSKKNSNLGTNSSSAEETTDILMSKTANGLLTARDGHSSDPEPPTTNKKSKKKKQVSLFDFISQMGNIIIDNLEQAIGKPHSRSKKNKPSVNLSQIIDQEALKKSNVKLDELVGLDDSVNSDSSSDSDYGYSSGYGYGYSDSDSDDEGEKVDSNGKLIPTSKGKSKGKSHGKHIEHGKHGEHGGKHGEHGGKHGEHGGKDGEHGGKHGEHGEHGEHGHGSHHNKNKVNELNGLTKAQEAEILKMFENGGEIPKGYAVLEGKNGEKVIVQTVYGIEDDDDAENEFIKRAVYEMEMELKDMEEKDLYYAKKDKVNKKHRPPAEFDYEIAEDEDFTPVIIRRMAKFHRVTVERDGRKVDERQRKPVEDFEYIEVDLEETAKTAKSSSKSKDKSKTDNEGFDSAQRTKLVKRFIEFELCDIESEGGTFRKVYVPIPPNVEYEWIQEKDDPTMIGKYPKDWGYKWTYGTHGRRIKVCYDKRSLVEEQTRDWKGNPMTVMKKVRMEVVEVECDDGKKRKIRRPIQKVEFELYEVQNEDGTFSIVKRPILFAQLENGTWKQLDCDDDFFYEQVEIDGHLVLQKRHKEYELVSVECDDGKKRKVKREVEVIEYEEVVDEVTGKKKVVPRQVRYGYVIVEDENGNKVRARKEILSEDEKFEYVGGYDDNGNFIVSRQKIRYGYKYDFNGRRIRYRLPDVEIIQDERGNNDQREVQYETVEVELEGGLKVKVLRRKEDFEYVMVTDEKTGETKYVRQKVQYKTTTKIDDEGNVITVRTKVTQDFDEVADGVDAKGNVVYKKVPREYETITMKNSNGEVITVKRAKRYNYETVVDANGVAHQVRKEKVKPKRVRKSVKRLISFPKPLPRSKSFSYLRRYPKHVEIKDKKGGGLKPSTSISNMQQVIQILKRNDDMSNSGGFGLFRSLRNDKEFYRKILLDAYAYRVRKAQLDTQIIDLQFDLATAQSKSQAVQHSIDYVMFEIRSKLPKLRLSKPSQLTIKKPPVDGSDWGAQTVLTMSEMSDFHKKVKSGMLTGKQLSIDL